MASTCNFGLGAQNLKRAHYYEISMCFYEVERVGHSTHFFSNMPLKKHAPSGHLAVPEPGTHRCTLTSLAGARVPLGHFLDNFCTSLIAIK